MTVDVATVKSLCCQVQHLHVRVREREKKGKEIEHAVNSSSHCVSSAVFISVHCQ